MEIYLSLLHKELYKVYLSFYIGREKNVKKHLMSHPIRVVLISFVIAIAAGCRAPKPILMDRNGIYKFPDDTEALSLLYLNAENKWVRLPEKVIPSTEMVIIYEKE